MGKRAKQHLVRISTSWKIKTAWLIPIPCSYSSNG
jgi:hypothetical protein